MCDCSDAIYVHTYVVELLRMVVMVVLHKYVLRHSKHSCSCVSSSY